MKTCSTCKHWENPATRLTRRTCEPIKVGECGLVDSTTGVTLFDQGRGMDVVVTVHDDSGLWSTLRTGENFGCINFQQKGTVRDAP